MDIHVRIISSIVILLLLICLSMVLKRLGVLDEEHGRIFSRLVTQVTLPALIFVSLARTELLWSEGEIALIMLVVTLICLLLGWGVAHLLRLERAEIAPVILVTGFGSSSLLGFALIAEVFPHDQKAMAEAAIISGLGVQPLLFTLGTIIAIYYGGRGEDAESPLQAVLRYFRSPIFIAFLCGGALSVVIDDHRNPALLSILDGVYVAGAANTFLVTLTIGLLLRVGGLMEIALIALAVGAVKLLVMPFLLWLPTHAMDLASWQVEVLILEGAMPSAMLAVVLCSAYGCDAKFAARLVFATTLMSVITVPIIFELLS